MKKIICLFLSVILVLSLCACKSGDGEKIRVTVLKGPTSIGMLKLFADSKDEVEHTLAGSADEITAPFISGDIDIATVPCNLASVLYNKLEGDVEVLAVNTLGVLYVVDNNGSVKSIEDLKGKTVYSTGKGTTPQYVMEYILEKNGLTNDVNVEYVSEASEAAALLASGNAEIAVLPEPFVTSAKAKNESLNTALSLTDEWKKVSENGTELITGVIIAKRSYVNGNRKKIDDFLAKYKSSCEYANAEIDAVAALCSEYGIIASEALAKKAIPNCNIKYMDKEEMKKSVSVYLSVLNDANVKAVGGKLPGDDFYYMG